MQYFIVFLEGIITFLSPCLLPMLPIYISYFAGGSQETSNLKVLKNALGFVVGFTLVFVCLGAFAGTIGRLLIDYKGIFNLITGAIVLLFGLHFLGIISLDFLNRSHQKNRMEKELGFGSSMIFGIVFSIGWSPCVGVFLGSALLLASQQGSALSGISMLFCYCLGLGIPFVASALLIGKLKATFDLIKRHYNLINSISGGFLILIGILMMTGYMGRFLSFSIFS